MAAGAYVLHTVQQAGGPAAAESQSMQQQSRRVLAELPCALPTDFPPTGHLFKAPAHCVAGGAAAQGGTGEEHLPQLPGGAGCVGAAARL